MPGKYNHASTYQSCETISARQQYVRAAEEQLVLGGAHARATLGAVAIMVKSERGATGEPHERAQMLQPAQQRVLRMRGVASRAHDPPW